jgi:hypothetical protein
LDRGLHSQKALADISTAFARRLRIIELDRVYQS